MAITHHTPDEDPHTTAAADQDHAAPAVPRPRNDVEAARAFAIEVARLLKDDRCEEIVVLDVSGVSQITDFIIIASGTSDRQMRSSADDVRKLAEERGFGVFRHSVDTRTTWYVLDCVDVITHIFEPTTRLHYDLEMLWGDVPRVAWERPGEQNRDHARLND
jgi:ribosome-associated protein